MPTFKNTSKVRIDMIYNGRKISIPPNGTIEGPPHLKIYKGLQVVSTDVPFQPIQKISISSEINQNNIQEIQKVQNHINEYSELPSISICILTKDKYELITDCINSILDKVFYPNTKIIVADTGSSDEKVLNYYKSLKNTRIPIEVYNIGKFHFGKNYNTVLFNISKTDYSIIQNNDTIALNDYISKLMKIAIVEKVGGCGPRMLYKNGLIQHDGQYMFNHAVGTGFINPGHTNISKHPNDVPKGRHIVDGITGAGLLVRNSLYKKLKGFDENFKDIYQDVHFNMVLRGNGYISVCDRDAEIIHYDNTSRKELWKAQEEAAKMWQDSNYLFHTLIPNDNVLRSYKRKNYTFSIITLVNNKEQYNNFLNDLKNQKYSNNFEVIAILT
jgi:GT2 family glycosyltransferase